MISKRDALLGRLAVEKGLISPAQLEESLREQERSPHTLGEVLVRRGSLKAGELQSLVEALSLEEVQHLQKTEYLFGQILVRQSLATQLQVNKCLEIQQKLAEKGASPLPRLGELLLEHGFIDRKTIALVLQEQEKALFSCPRCGKRYNVVGVEKERRYLCRGCGAPLAPAGDGAAQDVDDTLFGFELPSDRK